MLAKEVRPKKDTDRSQQRPLKLKKKEEKKKIRLGIRHPRKGLAFMVSTPIPNAAQTP
jgi:hypothetical protein